MSASAYRRRVGIGLLGALLVLGALVFLQERVWHERYDATADHRYTLSASTRALLAQLREPIQIRAVFTADLPAQFTRLRVQADDLLEEFRAQAGGRIQLERVDPAEDSLLRAEVLEEGLQEIQVAERTRGGAVARQGFFGLELRSGENLEVIPLVQSVEALEYELMLRVRKLAGLRKAVGVCEGRGANKVFLLEPGAGPPVPRSGFDAVFPSLSAELSGSYQTVVLDGMARVPDSMGMVLVAAPRALDSAALHMLDDWLQRGGDLLVLAPALDLSFAQTEVTARYTAPATAPLLWRYGIVVDSQMVLDRRHGAAFFGASPYGEPYPPFPEVREDGLNHQHPATSDIGSLLIPWTTSLDTFSVPGILSTTVLASTSSESWRMGAPYDLQPKDPTRGETWKTAAPSRRILALERTLRTPGGTARLVVISNALFATDFFVQWSVQGGEAGGMENLSLLLNAVDHLADEFAWSALREKRIVNRPLTGAADRNRHFWMALNILFAPLVFGFAGLLWWWRRRKLMGGGRKA